jgi:hypothetical protein
MPVLTTTRLPAVWPDDMALADVIAFIEQRMREGAEVEPAVLRRACELLRALKTLQVCLEDPPRALGFPADSRVLARSVSQSERSRGGLEIELRLWLAPTSEAARWANQLMRIPR